MILPSERFYRFIEEVEGRSRLVYLDSGGAPTIGIGHLLTKSERSSGKIIINGFPVRYRIGLSDSQIYALLKADTAESAYTVMTSVERPLTQNQFDALVSFTFNVGVPAFKTSTLLKRINSGDLGDVPTQLRRWIYDDGVVVQGLVNRREKEIKLWLS